MPKDELKQITIIIPTYNRHHYLTRLLSYYASKNTDASILVLDSSEAATAKLNQQTCEGLSKHITYHYFPSSTPVASKLLAGLKLVKTAYCAFCADDDLVFIEGLQQALAFLQENDDYVCADGIYLNFHQVNHDVNLHIEYASKGINAEDPGARIFRLFQKYESLFYGVFRTTQAIDIFSAVSKNPSLHYQELFQATSALLLGKSHRLPVFYAARQHCDPADTSRDKWQTYYWFAEDRSEFMQHYLQYREELWQFYQTHVSDKTHARTDLNQILDIAHAMYFGLGCPPAYFHSVLQTCWPQDSFRKPNMFTDNVCNQLKSARRVHWEEQLFKFFKWLPKKLASLYWPFYLKSLNRDIYKRTQYPWNCALRKELAWLTSKKEFRLAYQELCLYLGRNNAL